MSWLPSWGTLIVATAISGGAVLAACIWMLLRVWQDDIEDDHS